MFFCLDGVNDDIVQTRCVDYAPGQRPEDDYLIAMEPVRRVRASLRPRRARAPAL